MALHKSGHTEIELPRSVESNYERKHSAVRGFAQTLPRTMVKRGVFYGNIDAILTRSNKHVRLYGLNNLQRLCITV